MLRLYDTKLSGNAWKVRILLRQLDIPFERVTIDLATGATHEPAFKAKSRFARVPVLEFPDGRTLIESSAILLHFARGTALLPADPFLETEVTSWLLFEQADLMRALALPRFYNLRGIAGQNAAKIAVLREFGQQGLAKLEGWLDSHDWLVGNGYTIADLGVFPYVYMASEGDYDMSKYPAIRAWLQRVASRPGWVPLIEEGAR